MQFTCFSLKIYMYNTCIIKKPDLILQKEDIIYWYYWPFFCVKESKIWTFVYIYCSADIYPVSKTALSWYIPPWPEEEEKFRKCCHLQKLYRDWSASWFNVRLAWNIYIYDQIYLYSILLTHKTGTNLHMMYTLHVLPPRPFK